MLDYTTARPDFAVAVAFVVLLVAYLVRLNQLLLRTPDQIKNLASARWEKGLLRDTYRRLEKQPVETRHYANRIPPKLERRYIVTGGSGESMLRAIKHDFAFD
jgi:hypothetical protein